MSQCEMNRQLNDNCFDLIRLVLALAVVYSHGILLGGFGEEQFLTLTKHQTIAGSVSVLGFFGLSGFLVTKSFCSDYNIRRFIKGRLLRILPGFYLTILLCAFVFAPLVSIYNVEGKPYSFSCAIDYITDNFFVRIRNHHVGGVISGLPYDESFNGSLWSLFPELCCYGFTLFLGLTGCLGCKFQCLIIWGVFFLMYAASILMPDHLLVAPTFITLSTKVEYYLAFGTGIVAWVWRDSFDFGGRQAVVWCLLSALFLKFGGWELACPILLPITLLHVGYLFRFRLPADYSYGIYLLHFPLMHILSAVGVQQLGKVYYIGIAVIGSLILACLSWHFVEKPFLNLRNNRSADNQ